MAMVSGNEVQQNPEVAALQQEVREIRNELVAIGGKIRETDASNNEKIESLRNALHSANETINKYSRNLQFMEKRMEGMRTDTSTGIVLAILIFTLMFILSLFIR